MNTLSVHEHTDDRLEKFNGPILDREKLQMGTYVAMWTLIGSVFLVAAVKAIYQIF